MDWYTAGVICEEIYGVELNTAEGYFVCPDCGEPLFYEDWERHCWDSCPVCNFEWEVDT